MPENPMSLESLAPPLTGQVRTVPVSGDVGGVHGLAARAVAGVAAGQGAVGVGQQQVKLGRRGRGQAGHQVPVRCSGRIGTRGSSRPVAARTAAATAGPDEIVGASPTPRSP